MLRKYYTVQNIVAWNVAKEKGFLVGDEKYIWDTFIEAYGWMMEQMKLRIQSYSGDYPIWLWAKRPDLRCGGLLEPREQGILLEVLLPEENVLISNFELWHCVLNNGPIADTEEELELIEQKMALLSKEESWERIFDVDYLQNEKNIIVPTIQGVTGKININNIRPIKEFIARGVRL